MFGNVIINVLLLVVVSLLDLSIRGCLPFPLSFSFFIYHHRHSHFISIVDIRNLSFSPRLSVYFAKIQNFLLLACSPLWWWLAGGGALPRVSYCAPRSCVFKFLQLLKWRWRETKFCCFLSSSWYGVVICCCAAGLNKLVVRLCAGRPLILHPSQ